jgi:hypothetical protein
LSTRIFCDGCGAQISTGPGHNHWHSALIGDTMRTSEGRVPEFTGMIAPGNRQYVVNMLQADLCIPCMSKVQKGTK